MRKKEGRKETGENPQLRTMEKNQKWQVARPTLQLPDPEDHLVTQPHHCPIKGQRDSNIPKKIVKAVK